MVQIFAKCTVYEISPHKIFFTPRSILLELIGDNYEMGTANTNEYQIAFIANHSPQTIRSKLYIHTTFPNDETPRLSLQN